MKCPESIGEAEQMRKCTAGTKTPGADAARLALLCFAATCGCVFSKRLFELMGSFGVNVMKENDFCLEEKGTT